MALPELGPPKSNGRGKDLHPAPSPLYQLPGLRLTNGYGSAAILLPEDRQPTLDASACDDDANEFDNLIRALDEASRGLADTRHRGGSSVSEADMQGALEAFDTLLEDNA